MDPEASIPTGSALPPTQVAIEPIITKTFTRYRCDVITNHLHSVFTAKLWRMGKALQFPEPHLHVLIWITLNRIGMRVSAVPLPEIRGHFKFIFAKTVN